jgi:hypothetical protein
MTAMVRLKLNSRSKIWPKANGFWENRKNHGFCSTTKLAVIGLEATPEKILDGLIDFCLFLKV